MGKPKIVEIEEIIDGHTSQLADNASQLNQKTLQTSRNLKTTRPLVTFIDDDGDDGTLTKLKPLFTAKNVPIGIALMNTSKIIIDVNKRADVLNLQNNYGWEILSHTMTHIDIDLSTRTEVENDCKNLLDIFNGYGFNVRSIAYPWGKVGDKRDIISKYFMSGYNTNTGYNTIDSTKTYGILRYGIGSNMIAEMTTLAQFKALIDTVKINNGWLVLMIHADYAGNDMQLISDVLDYIIAQGIEIATPNEGLMTFGSMLQTGDVASGGNYLEIKNSGQINTNKYALINIIPNRLEVTAPTKSKDNGINTFAVTGWSLGDGIVTEYLHTSNDWWSYQEFKKAGRVPLIYTRKWDTTLVAWGAWERIVTSPITINYTLTTRTVGARSVIEATIYDASIRETNLNVVQPIGTLEAGLMFNGWSHGDGAYKLRIENCTDAVITLAERVWKIKRIGVYV